MSPASIGIIGTGGIATRVHIPVLRAMTSARIVWVTDANEDRGREVGRVNRLPYVPVVSDPNRLPPCDVVLLSIPLSARQVFFDHYADTQTAVLSEKPLALDATEHRRLMTTFQNWQLAVGYQRRCHATSQLLRQLIHSGAFGALLKVCIAEGGRVTRTGAGGQYQDESVARGGGIIKNLGCHSLDLALWLTGAISFQIEDRRVEWDGDTDRSGSAAIRLFGIEGAPGHNCELDWTVSWLEAQPNTIELQFERAFVRAPIAPSANAELLGLDGQLLAQLDATASGGAATSVQAFYLEWDDVIEAVRQRREPMLSARSCCLAAELMDELLDR
jgi:predicted dehydrogenase